MSYRTKTLSRMSGALFLIVSLNSAANDWYVRLVAENTVERLVDRGSVLGQAADASAEFDIHDLPELAPFSEPFLTVVFRKDEWGDKSGDYNSDIRSLEDTDSVWTFLVKSDDPAREVVLSWESNHRLDRMRLIDLSTGATVYPILAGRPMTYRFNMDGQNEREFLWKYRESGNFAQ